MADKSHWISDTQALAALTTALVAVGAFLGFSHGGKDRDAAPPAAPASHAPSPAPAPAAPQVGVTPVRAVLSLSDGDKPVASAVITVRIRNNGQVPIGVAWLDARRAAAFDLDNGAHLTGREGSAFTGFPDCARRRANDCKFDDTTTLVPGEEALATLTLGIRAEGDPKALAAAKTGTLTARLSVRPGHKADAYARSVSLANMALTNSVR